MELRHFSTVVKRRIALENLLSHNLSHIGNFSISEKIASSKNCENMVGVTQIPLGVAGPIKIVGDHIKGNYYMPFATTEGALVASINRGCKVITESGGVNVSVHNVGVTRGPVFHTGSIKKSNKFYKWIKTNKEKLIKVSEKTSKHLKYKKADINIQGSYVFVRFYFDTQDAMGMNMVTIATDKLAKLLEKETGADCIAIAGNFDTDKKSAWINFVNGRGFKVWGDVIISRENVKNILKTTPDKIFEVWLAKCMIGSAMAGSMGFNAHYANIVAAFFAATGQDIAHIVEGSMGITTAKVLKNGDLYFSVYLPSIMLGTVGGGTDLETQKEAIKITGAKKSVELAEVLGAAVLAGELSLISSLSQGTLSSAHQKLGRMEK